MWGISHEEVEKRSFEFHTSGTMRNYGHRPEAVKALHKAKENYNLVVVTSRRKLVLKETHDWVEEYFDGIFSGIHFAGIWDEKPSLEVAKLTKADICKQLNADFLIDDQLKHCLGAAEVGIPSLLFGDYTWNQADTLPELVTRVRDWYEVEKYFDMREDE